MGIGSENRSKRAVKQWLKMENLQKKGFSLDEIAARVKHPAGKNRGKSYEVRYINTALYYLRRLRIEDPSFIREVERS